ncbi:MAG: hypothetical protein AB1782_08610 [Cyanobacteriota bacterium]
MITVNNNVPFRGKMTTILNNAKQKEVRQTNNEEDLYALSYMLDIINPKHKNTKVNASDGTISKNNDYGYYSKVMISREDKSLTMFSSSVHTDTVSFQTVTRDDFETTESKNLFDNIFNLLQTVANNLYNGKTRYNIKSEEILSRYSNRFKELGDQMIEIGKEQMGIKISDFEP